jgi:hypothetical protein
LFGDRLQPSTRQLWDTKLSQYVASVPAQSAALVHGFDMPTGGCLQTLGETAVSQP